MEGMSNSAEEGGGKVLLIEDNDEFRMLLGRLLSLEGFGVHAVETGDKAIEALRHQHFDLILTDLIVPGLEGIEIILTARGLAPETRIIAMSGGAMNGGHDYLPLAEKMGAAAVLQKPFDRAQLVETISRVMGAA